ncbi:MAG TPA: hypothetical protein VFK13_09385 [Gemmatimonadaceae bacterium]|nr:hypothetical protein [Gemmatimonadaceae bacterium]
MAEHIHTYSVRVEKSGIEYEARIYGARRVDDTWTGWIEFHPLQGPALLRRTGEETTQPDRDALEYWAGGLDRVYLESAYDRAIPAGVERRSERDRRSAPFDRRREHPSR